MILLRLKAFIFLTELIQFLPVRKHLTEQTNAVLPAQAARDTPYSKGAAPTDKGWDTNGIYSLCRQNHPQPPRKAKSRTILNIFFLLKNIKIKLPQSIYHHFQ